MLAKSTEYQFHSCNIPLNAAAKYRSKRKCPTHSRSLLNHVDLVRNLILTRIVANLQVAIAKPEIIEVADAIERTELGAYVPVIVPGDPDV